MKWYKGEEKLKPKKSDKRLTIFHDLATELHTVVISSAMLSDTAKYTVKAVNKYGSIKASVKIEVKKVSEEMKEEKKEVSVTVDEGVHEEEKIVVEIKSFSETVGKSLLEEVEVRVDKSKGRESTEEFEVDEAQLNKKKKLEEETVREEPDEEKLSSKALLTESPEIALTEEAAAAATQSVPDSELEKGVGIAPSFVIKPQSVAVVEGDTIRLQCKVKG